MTEYRVRVERTMWRLMTVEADTEAEALEQVERSVPWTNRHHWELKDHTATIERPAGTTYPNQSLTAQRNEGQARRLLEEMSRLDRDPFTPADHLRSIARDLRKHFRSKPFEWCWPKVNVYVPADKRPRTLLNRYPHNVIGAAVVVFGRCWGVQWKQSKGTRRVGPAPAAKAEGGTGE